MLPTNRHKDYLINNSLAVQKGVWPHTKARVKKYIGSGQKIADSKLNL